VDDANSSVAGKWASRLWYTALAVSFVLSIWAAARGGYIGPDYDKHFGRLIDSSKLLDFSASNPPIYYVVGHALFRIIGPTNAFPITLSIIQAGANIAALWFFVQYLRGSFASSVLCFSFACFLALLPVRMIHTVAIGADSTTIPLFVLLLFCFDRFLRASSLKNALYFGATLAVSVFTKYSFMALLPATLIIMIFLKVRRAWPFSRLISICAAALVLPASLTVYSFWASARLHGYNTEKHWRIQAVPPDMDFADLFGLKAADIELFRAPEYFKSNIRAPHRHSYLVLSHMGTFTDPMNLFQDLTVPQRFGATLIPDQKTRRPWKTPVMEVSMAIGVVWTLLALFGTGWTLFAAVRHLARDRLEHEDLAALFGTSFFLLMFLPIPFVHAGALFGYWTPRLILPALLYFFWSGFLFLDRKIAPGARWVSRATLALVLVQCLLTIVMLV
jgi:4-amino-4-deoxy-L-arabinose transferase-like glycosyltransferase